MRSSLNIFIASMQKYLHADWSRGVITLCESPKIIEPRLVENIFEKKTEITKVFLIRKYNWQKT